MINGSLGSLLRVWAAVEESVRDEVIRAHGCLPASAYGIAAMFRTWERMVTESRPATSLGPLLATTLRGQLQGPLDIRNGLCHGLIGTSAATDQMPAALYWEINGQKHSICWDDLQKQLAWLSKLPLAVSVISNSSLERLGNRVADTAENREWWQSEFSLDLPER